MMTMNERANKKKTPSATLNQRDDFPTPIEMDEKHRSSYIQKNIDRYPDILIDTQPASPHSTTLKRY